MAVHLQHMRQFIKSFDLESKVSNSGLVEKLADFACKQSGQDIGEIDLNSGAVKSTHQTSCNVASTSTIMNSTKGKMLNSTMKSDFRFWKVSLLFTLFVSSRDKTRP